MRQSAGRSVATGGAVFTRRCRGYRLRDAIDAGCTLFTGETWLPEEGRRNQSLSNHQRDGWRPVYTRVNYVSATDEVTDD